MLMLLFAIGVTVIHYLVLSAIAWLWAQTTTQLLTTYRRWRSTQPNHSDANLNSTTTFLIIFAVWHVFLNLVLTSPARSQIGIHKYMGCLP